LINRKLTSYDAWSSDIEVISHDNKKIGASESNIAFVKEVDSLTNVSKVNDIYKLNYYRIFH
jgi:hypothetical protein